MNKRRFVYGLLGFIICSGMVAGLFSSSIQQALTLPVAQAQTEPEAPPQEQHGQYEEAQLVAQDTFQRNDQSSWEHASDGQLWEIEKDAQPFFSIVEGVGLIENVPGSIDALLGPVSQNVDVTLSGMIGSSNETVGLGIVLRWQDANNWYQAMIDGNRLLLVKRVDGGGPLILDEVPFSAQSDVLHHLRFQALGALLFVKIWRDDVAEPEQWMLTTSDPTFSDGRIGIQAYMLTEAVIHVHSFKAVTASIQSE